MQHSIKSKNSSLTCLMVYNARKEKGKNGAVWGVQQTPELLFPCLNPKHIESDLFACLKSRRLYLLMRLDGRIVRELKKKVLQKRLNVHQTKRSCYRCLSSPAQSHTTCFRLYAPCSVTLSRRQHLDAYIKIWHSKAKDDANKNLTVQSYLICVRNVDVFANIILYIGARWVFQRQTNVASSCSIASVGC